MLSRAPRWVMLDSQFITLQCNYVPYCYARVCTCPVESTQKRCDVWMESKTHDMSQIVRGTRWYLTHGCLTHWCLTHEWSLIHVACRAHAHVHTRQWACACLCVIYIHIHTYRHINTWLVARLTRYCWYSTHWCLTHWYRTHWYLTRGCLTHRRHTYVIPRPFIPHRFDATQGYCCHSLSSFGQFVVLS